MFKRRLVLLFCMMMLGVVVLMVQMFRLTVVQGELHRTEAESILSSKQLIDTIRGSIYDRKGRLLAEDRACYDVQVNYDVITGEWAYRKARRAAYLEHRNDWGRIDFERREALIDQYIGPFEAQIDAMWEELSVTCNVPPEQIEDQKKLIKAHVASVRSHVWKRALQKREIETDEEVTLSDVAVPIREQYESHTVLHAIEDHQAYLLRQNYDRLPGVVVVRSKTRVYPMRSIDVEVERNHLPTPLKSDIAKMVPVDSVAPHILGDMREVWVEDMDPKQGGRPFLRHGMQPDLGGYRPGDQRGMSGIEAAAEELLRGTRGIVYKRRDTGEKTHLKPAAGRDVKLTLDIYLQARIQALMSPQLGLMKVQPWHNNPKTPLGTELYGAAIVMSVDNGDVLAMVSSPSPPRRQKNEPYPDLTNDPSRPLLNRALTSVYAPGSTVKPIVYAIAAKYGLVGHHHEIECKGHLLEDHVDKFRCWGWRPKEGKYLRHGFLRPSEAIARSCNIYFYSCGRKLGAERLIIGLHEFGIGKSSGLGMPGEVDGLMPELTGPTRSTGGMSLSSATMMGIGQGPIAVPPMQIAVAHAALARGGVYIPGVLMEHLRDEGQERSLFIDKPIIDEALKGMYDSANASYGTGAYLPGVNPTVKHPKGEMIFNIDKVKVYSKTGTAQTSPQYDDLNNNQKRDAGEPILRDGTHSWYVCHIIPEGEKIAKYVIVVIVEYGGSGGRVSGPITNQILHAMRAEGYL